MIKSHKIFILLAFLGLSISANAQKGKFEAELTANLSMETNLGTYGIFGSAGMNYYFIDRIGLNTNIGGFQSFIKWKHENTSLFKWDVDVFFDVLKTKKDHRLRLSLGASWYRGATSWVSTSAEWPDGRIEILEERVDFHNGIGANAKIQYRFPIAEKWHLGINGECYYLPHFSYYGIVPALGVSVGYRF